jgi:hypothetical protein
MAKYAISNGTAGTQQAMTTTYKTAISLTAATGATTLRRAYIYDAMFGADGTPADNVLTYKADRQTSVGTGTAATAAPIDAADAACLVTETVNHTVEPTVTASTQLIEIPVNQRASYRWVASPGGELIVPAVDVTGIGFRGKSPAYTGTIMCTVHFFE